MSSAWWQVDWVWTATGWSLGVVGVALLVWALFWDRAKGRRRCPGCWYDMSGAVVQSAADGAMCVCPECGTKVTRERQVGRTRRRWGWAVGAMAMLVLAAGPWVRREIVNSTWPRLVPSWVLVRWWPIDEVAWFETRASGAIVNELDRRTLRNHPYVAMSGCFGPLGETQPWMSDDNAKVWARRVADSVIESLRSTGDPRSVVLYDLRPSLQGVETPGEEPLSGPIFTSLGYNDHDWTRADRVRQLVDVVTASVDFDGWVDNGGDQSDLAAAGVFLIVRAKPEIHTKIRDFLDKLEWAVEKVNAKIQQTPP